MHYITLFDAGLRPLKVWVPAISFGFMVVTFLIARLRWKRFWPRLCFLLVTLWTLVTVCVVGWDYYSARDALISGQYQVVEGRVSGFHPMPARRHDHEHFTVNGVRFEYSHDSVSACFNDDAASGGPIREGLPVRVTYRGNCILRLEVANGKPN